MIELNLYSKDANTILAILGTLFTWLFGAWDLSLMILVTVMALDYVTGVTRGYVNKQLSSEYGFRGLAKKLTIFYVLILAVLIDRIIGNGWIFRTLVIYFYIAMEGISILENATILGVPFPTKLKDVLVQLKEGNKKDITKE